VVPFRFKKYLPKKKVKARISMTARMGIRYLKGEGLISGGGAAGDTAWGGAGWGEFSGAGLSI
jgi:hypothetical protein